MAYVNHISTIVPEFPHDQTRIREVGRRVLKGKIPFLEQALNLFNNAGVEQRYFVRDVDEILDHEVLGWRNEVFKQASIDLGIQLLEDVFQKTGLEPDQVDAVITTSCTGFMIPALDAYLINHFRMRPDIKRLPFTELGCAAGAMALSRAREYLAAFPEHRVLIIAIELPSLTCRGKDFRIANLVSAALFGDGGAAALLSGQPSTCRLKANCTHFYYDTPELMGFDLTEEGFKILLDKRISDLILDDFVEPLNQFLSSQNVEKTDLKHFVFHPGGRKIMDSLRTVLNLDEAQLWASRKVLREVGNLSSASILWVLWETLRTDPKGLGILGAFGPGFNAELLLADFA